MNRTPIWLMSVSYDDRPLLDFEKHGYWDEWKELEQSFPEGVDTLRSKLLEFDVDEPDALEWHWYSIPGTGGAWSAAAKELLWPYTEGRLRCFQTTLNGALYYILRLDEELGLDCLDHERSEIEYFECDPKDVKGIHHYAFHLDRIKDPLIFFVPELRDLMATDSIRKMVEQAGLKGFQFLDPNPPKPCRHPSSTTYRYENAYFNIRLDVPNNWEICTPKKGTARPFDPKRSGGYQFQRTDDDLPVRPGGYRHLITAYLHLPGHESLNEALIEMSVFRFASDDVAVLDERTYPENRIDCARFISQGTWHCNGLDVRYLDDETPNSSGGTTCWNRFVFWKVGDRLWIHARIAGFKDVENFEHAKSVFATLAPLS